MIELPGKELEDKWICKGTRTGHMQFAKGNYIEFLSSRKHSLNLTLVLVLGTVIGSGSIWKH